MIHPSYIELMNIVNQDSEDPDHPIVRSRYSIVTAAAKRARQLIDHADPLVDDAEGQKPLSIAVEELQERKVKILPQEDPEEEEDNLPMDINEELAEAAETAKEIEEARQQEAE